MRIVLSTESTGLAYFPGLAQDVTIDSQQLPEDAADTLQRLVQEANFFEQPDDVCGSTRAFDIRQYSLTIQDGRRRHTVTLTDQVEDPALRALLAEVQEVAQEKRQTPAKGRRGSKTGKPQDNNSRGSNTGQGKPSQEP
ncbi:MAG: hypothetical protein KIT87_10070 [Anaerolineae bacterium]|nr:hypothetical protein [Anaerolineae bacterium]